MVDWMFKSISYLCKLSWLGWGCGRGGGGGEESKLALRRVVSEAVPAGTEIPGGVGRGRLYLTLHCHHQNDSCISMGSDESQPF